MYSKILVPFDGSDVSLRALQEALQFAKQQGAQLRILHVVSELVLDYSAAGAYAGTLIDALRRAGNDILRNAQVLARGEGLEPELRLLESIGRPAAASIVEHAQHWQADLIVMGTHGRRGLRRLALGSDAEQVVRTAPVPVLLVHATQAAAE